MSATMLEVCPPHDRPLARLLRAEPWLASLGLACLLALVPSLFGLALDDRLVAGLPNWLKPIKFQLSVGLHLLTVALALRLLPAAERAGAGPRRAVALIVATSAFEVGYITLQGARGLPSHYATDALLPALLFASMGVAATVLVLATAWLGWRLVRAARGALALAAGLGLLVSGLTGLVSGGVLSVNGGHFVGVVPAGAASLPLLGWSGSVGDLRVGHFVGLHAAQAVPLLALALRNRPETTVRRAAIVAAGLLAAASLALTAQALAGLPAVRF